MTRIIKHFKINVDEFWILSVNLINNFENFGFFDANVNFEMFSND